MKGEVGSNILCRISSIEARRQKRTEAHTEPEIKKNLSLIRYEDMQFI